MKKFTCIMMALLLVLSFASFSAQAEGDVKLTFTGWGDANEKAVMQSILDKYTADTGNQVEYTYIPSSSEYITRITAMAASGELPDAGYMSEFLVVPWANENMLLDLSPMLEGEGFAEKMDSNKFIDKDGRVVGISMSVETLVMYYNPTYFDQMGIAYPPSKGEDAWTWDEFVDVCRQLTVDANGKHPNEEGFDANNIRTFGVKINRTSEILNALMRSNGGGIYTEDYSDIALDRPESIEVLQAVADLINVEHVAPAPDNSASSMDNASAFLSNSIAMVVDGQWAIQSLAVSAEEDGIAFDVAVLPCFKTPVTGNTGGPAVVFNTTKHPDEARQLVGYILNTDYVMEFIHSGLWQPNTVDWYTDEDLINQWIVEGVHPAHYRDAVIDYTLNYMQPSPYFHVGCTQQIDNLWKPAMDNAISGISTAQECVDSVIDEMRKVYSEYLASIS